MNYNNTVNQEDNRVKVYKIEHDNKLLGLITILSFNGGVYRKEKKPLKNLSLYSINYFYDVL